MNLVRVLRFESPVYSGGVAGIGQREFHLSPVDTFKLWLNKNSQTFSLHDTTPRAVFDGHALCSVTTSTSDKTGVGADYTRTVQIDISPSTANLPRVMEEELLRLSYAPLQPERD